MELVIYPNGKVGKDDIISVGTVNDCKLEMCMESDMLVTKLKIMAIWACQETFLIEPNLFNVVCVWWQVSEDNLESVLPFYHADSRT